MGQKVNPHGARVGVILDWSTKWYAGKKDFSNNLIDDYKLRNWLKDKLNAAGISHIDVERTGETIGVNIFTAKPGIVIGKGGKDVEVLKKEIQEFTGKENVRLNILEIKNPECDAQLVAENIAQQLEKRVSFRRAMKQTIGRAMKAGAKGIKTTVSGRLGGADIARSEGYHEGSIPLQTLRANIDYGFSEAKTTYGRIGVKVWIYKGQVLQKALKAQKRGRMKGKAQRGNFLAYGEYGLVATQPGWITSNQIEAARQTMTRTTKRGGNVWIKIFPDKPVTAKPAETRMGSGKGAPEYWVAVVKPGRVLFEMGGIDEATAKEALRLAGHKLPIKTKIISKETQAGGEEQ